MEDLDRALADAIFGHANMPDSEPISLTVPPEVLAALQPPQPKDDVEKLIASADCEWPIRIASHTEAL